MAADNVITSCVISFLSATEYCRRAAVVAPIAERSRRRTAENRRGLSSCKEASHRSAAAHIWRMQRKPTVAVPIAVPRRLERHNHGTDSIRIVGTLSCRFRHSQQARRNRGVEPGIEIPTWQPAADLQPAFHNLLDNSGTVA